MEAYKLSIFYIVLVYVVEMFILKENKYHDNIFHSIDSNW